MQVKYLKNLTLLGRGEGNVRDTAKQKTPFCAFLWVLEALSQGKAVFNPVLCLMASKIPISPLPTLMFQGI